MPTCAGVTRSGERCRRFVSTGSHCASHKGTTGNTDAVAVTRNYFSPESIVNLNSTHRRQQLIGLNALNRIQTEADARAFLGANVLQRVVDFSLSEVEDTVLRDRAAWVLINLTSAPGDAGALAIVAVRPDFFTTVSEIILTNEPAIIANFLWCLGNMAASVPAHALQMIDAEIHWKCMNILKDPQNSRNLAKLAAFVLSNLASHTLPQIAQELMMEMSLIPPIVLMRIELLEDLLWTIQKLYSQCGHIEANTCALLIGGLDCISNKIVKPSLETLADICASNNTATINTLIISGLIPRFHAFFSKPIFKNMAMFCLSNLACEQKGAQRILETPGLLMDLMVALPSRDSVWTICNLAQRGGEAALGALLRCGMIPALLSVFRGASDPMKIIILESLIELLKKRGGLAFAQLRLNGLANLPTTHTNERIAELLLEMQEEVGRYAGVDLPAAAAPEATEIVGSAQPLTVASSLAAARIGEAVSRGIPQTSVDISDLVFTAADVAHLIGLGYSFRHDGHLFASTA